MKTLLASFRRRPGSREHNHTPVHPDPGLRRNDGVFGLSKCQLVLTLLPGLPYDRAGGYPDA